MNFKIINSTDDYDVVYFPFSLYKNIKKKAEKQSNFFYKLINPSNKAKQQFTVIPTQYNQSEMLSALMAQQDFDKNGIVGFVVKNDKLFENVTKNIFKNGEQLYSFNYDKNNIIISPDNDYSLNKVKSLIINEKFNLNLNNLNKKNLSFKSNTLSTDEQSFIKNIISEKIIEIIDNHLECSEDYIFLLEATLCSISFSNKRTKEAKRLMDLLNIAYEVYNNEIFFDEKHKTVVNNIFNRYIDDQLFICGNEIEVQKDREIINTSNIEKHVFNYKKIEELIADKNIKQEHDKQEINIDDKTR